MLFELSLVSGIIQIILPKIKERLFSQRHLCAIGAGVDEIKVSCAPENMGHKQSRTMSEVLL
jgi:hypothetical protein